jgi:hypothetical protein
MLVVAALTIIVALAAISSGVIGLVAHHRLSGSITVRNAIGPLFRIAIGMIVLLLMIVYEI